MPTNVIANYFNHPNNSQHLARNSQHKAPHYVVFFALFPS